MNDSKINAAALDMAQGATPYELARKLVQARERIAELESQDRVNEPLPRLWLRFGTQGLRMWKREGFEGATEYVRADLTDVRQIYALADIRAAIGDAQGKLMLDEVVARVQTMAEATA